MSDSNNHWTIPSLKEYLLTLINENDRRYGQQFDSSTVVVNAALAAAKEAVIKAENATEKRFENVNEFRATLADQQRTLMPRNESELQMASLSARIKSLELSLTEDKGTKIGESVLFSYIVGAVGIILTIIAFILKK